MEEESAQPKEINFGDSEAKPNSSKDIFQIPIPARLAALSVLGIGVIVSACDRGSDHSNIGDAHEQATKTVAAEITVSPENTEINPQNTSVPEATSTTERQEDKVTGEYAPGWEFELTKWEVNREGQEPTHPGENNISISGVWDYSGDKPEFPPENTNDRFVVLLDEINIPLIIVNGEEFVSPGEKRKFEIQFSYPAGREPVLRFGENQIITADQVNNITPGK